MDSIPSEPVWVISEVVKVLKFHVLNHPLGTLSVAIIPGAEASALLGPQVKHLSGLIEWVRYCRGDTEGEADEAELAPIVADVVVYPPEEELVLQPGVEIAVNGPEHELVRCYREGSLEAVARALLEWDPEECLGW